MTGPRILTFNFHEPYLCLMARIGYPITVGLYDSGELQRPWHTRFRPIPDNVTLARESEWRHDLRAGKFEVLVAHNETNAATVYKSAVPALLVCHNRRSFIRTNFPPEEPHELRAFDRLLDRLQERFEFVFISESKRDDYGIPGHVIPPGIDVDAYGGYAGDRAEILRVGNSMRERYRMFDVDFQETVVAGLPNRVVGVNALIAGSEPADSFDTLLELYRHARAMLHVSREAYEDGYNLAMLEAMACGMPVVALANSSSPLTDGVDGFLSYEAEVLRGRLQDLLHDRELAQRVGQRGRATVAAKFPMDRFVERWRAAIEEVIERRGTLPRWQRVNPPDRKVLLLQYDSGPASVARFAEWALRRTHEVISMGRRIERGSGPGFPMQQIAIPEDDVERELETLTAAGRGPEAHLWIVDGDCGPPAMPRAVADTPKLCWVLNALPPLDRLAGFDRLYIADTEMVGAVRHAGLRVEWLPHACAPELFAGLSREEDADVLIVCADSERRDALARHVAPVAQVVVSPLEWPYDRANQFMRARIVVHDGGIDQDLFQALGSGALVMSSAAFDMGWQDEAGLRHGTHLVVWRSERELIEGVKRYLADADIRTRIAGAGRRFVLAHHTYERRMEQIMGALAERTTDREPQDERLEVGGYYRSPRPELAVHVPMHTPRMLDVGCGAGEFGRALKAERGVQHVTGIEIVESAWTMATRVLDEAIFGNIETLDLPFPDEHFDCITCGDVLEHLVNPGEVLMKLKRVLAPGGTLVASIPNARFYQVVEMLGNGRWIYQDAGIMDRTHLRFFTAVEMVELFRGAGMRVRTIAPLSMMREDALPISKDGFIELQKMRIGPLSPAEHRDFLVYQYLVIAEHRDADAVQQAQQMLDTKQNDQAFALAQRALDEGEDRAQCLRIMAKSGARLGRVAEAEAWYRESLALREDAETRGEYGLVLFALGRCVDARTQLEAAHASLPSHARILSGLGLCDLAAGRGDEAFAHFSASLAQEFDNEAAVEHLVGAAQQIGRLQDAEPYVKRFVEFYPGNLDMGCVYAAVLVALGRHDEARARLENVLLFDPGHARALTLRETLEGR